VGGDHSAPDIVEKLAVHAVPHSVLQKYLPLCRIAHFGRAVNQRAASILPANSQASHTRRKGWRRYGGHVGPNDHVSAT
jgi:hypothetical protein